MAIEVYATTTDLKEASSIKVENKEILTTLGPNDESVAVKLKELFTSVVTSISEDLEVESQMSIEITGSIDLKVQAGVKYLFFNLGGETTTTATMKVVLATTIKPKGR